MIDSRLAWFAIGALCGAVLFGWPWHPRFSRYGRRGSNPPPYSSAAIAEMRYDALSSAAIAEMRYHAATVKHAAQLYAKVIDPSMGEHWEEGRTQRGNGSGGPTAPKPPLEPQPTGGRVIDKSGMTIGYQPLPWLGLTTPPPREP